MIILEVSSNGKKSKENRKAREPGNMKRLAESIQSLGFSERLRLRAKCVVERCHARH